MSQEIILLKFKGLDSFNRPVYKVEGKAIYIGSTSILFSSNATKESINSVIKNNLEELVLFGSKFDCEPEGTRLNFDKVKIEII